MTHTLTHTLNPIPIGISSCLLGHKVRYDGNHSHDPYLTRTLGLFVTYVPVCPEVESGLPVPRNSLRLEGDPESPRLITRKTGADETDRMQAWIPGKLAELETQNLCGFIFKSKSPSSGLYRIPVHGPDGSVHNTGSGLFAKAFTRHFPLIPVEEAGRLNDPVLREHFIESIFSFQRWREFCAADPSPGDLVTFHTRNKLLILSHSPELYREMGRQVAEGGKTDRRDLLAAYQDLLLRALSPRTTVKKHINVLMHAMGFFKNELTAAEKRELLAILDHYRQGYVPLIVPLTLIRHYVLKYEQPWLGAQTYLDPHPFELKLRNYF